MGALLVGLGGQGEHHVLGLHEAPGRERIVPHAVHADLKVPEQAVHQRQGLAGRGIGLREERLFPLPGLRHRIEITITKVIVILAWIAGIQFAWMCGVCTSL
jgi:hypothetical protein